MAGQPCDSEAVICPSCVGSHEGQNLISLQVVSRNGRRSGQWPK